MASSSSYPAVKQGWWDIEWKDTFFDKRHVLSPPVPHKDRPVIECHMYDIRYLGKKRAESLFIHHDMYIMLAQNNEGWVDWDKWCPKAQVRVFDEFRVSYFK